MTYEAYVVSRTSTRPQVDSADSTTCVGIADAMVGCDHGHLTDGGLPQLDVARVQRWCASQVPD